MSSAKTDVFYWRLFFILIIGVFCFNSSCNPQPPDKWVTPIKTEPVTAPTTTDELVVYLDTSLSMAGYILPSNQKDSVTSPDSLSSYSRSLLELRSVVTSLSPQVSVVYRKVGADVGAPTGSDLELQRAAINRTVYSEGETNLAGAFKSFSIPIKGDDPNAPVPRFHVLITDGVQSKKSETTGLDCAKGSDSVCVKKQILSLLEKGWGATILGLRSEFNGTVYSEVNPAIKIQHLSRGKDSATFRPFYLYILSPDRAALDKLSETLKERLRTIATSGESIRECPLTSAYTDNFASAELTFSDKNAESYGEIVPSKSKETAPPRFLLRVKRSATNALPLSLKLKIPWSSHAKYTASEKELLGLLTWQLEVVNETKGEGLLYPELKLTKPQIDENGQLEMNVEWLRQPGKPAFRMYRLVGRLDLEKRTPPWVTAWSSNLDTTADTATKTLNLESSLANLWRNPALEKQVIAECDFLVGESFPAFELQ